MRQNRSVLWLSVWLVTNSFGPALAQDLKSSNPEFRMTPSGEEYRKRLFEKTLNQPSCLILTKGLSSNRLNDVPEVSAIIQNLTEVFDSKDATKLKNLFHPRLKMSGSRAAQLLSEVESSYGDKGKINLSLFRVYALNTVSGEPANIDCPEDKLSLGTHYGFPVQFGAWFQLIGRRELGRLYITLVPGEKSWHVSAWHLQQWTHATRDAEAWVTDALNDSSKNLKPSAYAKLDIAYKLLDGGKFVYLQLRSDIKATRDSILPGEGAWLNVIKQALPQEPLTYAGTYLAPNGAGVLIRLAIDKEPNLESKQKACNDLSARILSSPWAKPLAGVHCDFAQRGAPANLRGAYGGISVNR
jgi:hypothetical protein